MTTTKKSSTICQPLLDTYLGTARLNTILSHSRFFLNLEAKILWNHYFLGHLTEIVYRLCPLHVRMRSTLPDVGSGSYQTVYRLLPFPITETIACPSSFYDGLPLYLLWPDPGGSEVGQPSYHRAVSGGVPPAFVHVFQWQPHDGSWVSHPSGFKGRCSLLTVIITKSF